MWRGTLGAAWQRGVANCPLRGVVIVVGVPSDAVVCCLLGTTPLSDDGVYHKAFHLAEHREALTTSEELVEAFMGQCAPVLIGVRIIPMNSSST